MPVEVRRAGDRFVTRAEGRTTRHSFSFDRHYDPDNVGWGALVCHNDDVLAPGQGYPFHPHRDLEIVSWVLSGTLRHEDSAGRVHEVWPGTVQRLCAGTGVQHSETNAAPAWRPVGTSSPVGPVRFVQMWLRPGEPGLAPAYDLAEVGTPAGGWVAVAGDAVPISTPGARLHVARLAPGTSLSLPEAPLLHLFVAVGRVGLEAAGELGEGDAARCADDPGRRLTAAEPAELLLWELG